MACLFAKTISLVLLAAGAVTAAPASQSRGYVTTPGELRDIAAKARRGLQPYKDAVEGVLRYATGGSEKGGAARGSDYWPYPTPGSQVPCHGSYRPAFLAQGSPLVEAKAMAYWLTGDASYAASARKHVLELASTGGYGGPKECICQLAWYVPGWIIAADLLEGYSGWTKDDRQRLQQWLASTVYPKTSFASDVRSNNIGAAASATSAMIADYSYDSTAPLTDIRGNVISPHAAYQLSKERQLDRMNGNPYMRHQPGCPEQDKLQGIRPDGGIPWELARGTTGCDGKWIVEKDKSWGYQQVALQGFLLHAELLLRRGDSSLYDNGKKDGGGSIRRAVLFLVKNPNNPAKSTTLHPSHMPAMELAYRYYRDPSIGEALGALGPGPRFIGGRSGQMMHFGTITHGFAESEDPPTPPTVSPP